MADSRQPLRRSGANGDMLFDPRMRSYIAIRDVTPLPTDTVPPPAKLVNAFRDARARYREPAKSLGDSGSQLPKPGGRGMGVTFRSDVLTYQQETAAYYYLIVPQMIGGQPEADVLYLTSSNRAPKGCEALVSFVREGDDWQAVFRIYDWATLEDPETDRFVRAKTYEQLADYLIPYQVKVADTSQTFDTIYVVSSTRRLHDDRWVNEVYLHNHALGVRDCVYRYEFDWGTQATDTPYFWGPIFEAFPSAGADFKTTNLLGFLEASIVQDGATFQLDESNSSLERPSNCGLDLVYEVANGSLICN